MEYVLLNGELYHHGTKGMRWGIRRYQNKDGSLTPAGKKRYAKEMEKLKQEKKTLRNQQRTQAKLDKLDALKKEVDDLKKSPKTAEEEAAAKKAYEEGKQQALKSGSAAEVLKYKGDLTQQEMQAAWSRIQWEQSMSGAAARDAIPTGKSTAEKTFDTVGKITDYANTGIKAWNTVANIYNAFNDGVSMPKIDANITNNNKEQRKKEKKEKQKAEEAQKKRAEQEAQKETKQKERAEKKAQKAKEESEQNQSNEKKQKTEDRKVYEGTVEGKGTSKYTEKKNDTVVDAEWREMDTDTPISNVPAEIKRTGESYALALLEDLD